VGSEMCIRDSPLVVQQHGVLGARTWVKNMITDVIVGIDKSERMIRLALTSMAMFGLPAARLHLANSLVRVGPDAQLTQSMEGSAGLVLTNPPFGAEFEGADLAKYKIAASAHGSRQMRLDSEVLFLERYVDWLAPGGLCLAIVPDSILTHRGIYGELRDLLRNQIEIRSVVSLPSETFGAAGTNTKTSILHLRKRGRRSGTSHTFFAICHEIGYSVATRQTQRTKVSNGHSELPKILEEYEKPGPELTIARRVVQAESASRWDATFHASLPAPVAQRLQSPSPADVFIKDVADLSKERVDPTRWELSLIHI